MDSKFCLFFGLVLAATLHAETGYNAWLRYEALDGGARSQYREAMPPVVVAFGSSSVMESARWELIRGIRGMLGRTLRVESRLPRENAILLGTLDEMRRAAPQLQLAARTFHRRLLAEDGRGRAGCATR